MSNTHPQWTGQVSVDHLAHLSKAVAILRNEAHLAVTDNELVFAARSGNNRCCGVGSTAILDVDESRGRMCETTKTLVNIKSLRNYSNSFDDSVCQLAIAHDTEDVDGEVTLSSGSLTINTFCDSHRHWRGPFREPEYRADLEIDIGKLIPALKVLYKSNPGTIEDVLIGVSEQVMYAYAWGDQVEMLLEMEPLEVHTCLSPFYSVYPYDTLLDSLRAFETDSPIRMKVATAQDPDNWAVGGQAKLEAVDTEYDLTLWVKPQHKPNAGPLPPKGQRLLTILRD